MMLYLLQSTLCMSALLAAYLLLLEKEKIYRFNRAFLLASIFISFIIPLVRFESDNTPIPAATEFISITWVDAVPIPSPPSDLAVSVSSHRSISPLLIIYFVVTSFLLSRFLYNIFQLLCKARRNKRVGLNGVTLILSPDVVAPYSFLRFIFLNQSEYERKQVEQEIIEHELAHVRQLHSIDIILMEILLAVCWFNPILYLYRRSIELNHEFLADDQVIHEFEDTPGYQHLLLSRLSRTRKTRLSSSFNYQQIKKRLIMMTRKHSPSSAIAKQIVLLPVVVALLFLLSTRNIVAQDTPDFKVSNPTLQRSDKDTILNPSKSWVWAGTFIKGTNEGASDVELQEYRAITDKYIKADKSWWQDLSSQITTEDKSRMIVIFKKMTLEQQKSARVAFIQPAPPLARKIPGLSQFDSFKNASIYGVWINEKRVSNETLKKYSNTDFSQVMVSKLYGAAKKGRSYTHQVNLMTNEYYNSYRDRTLKQMDDAWMVPLGQGYVMK